MLVVGVNVEGPSYYVASASSPLHVSIVTTVRQLFGLMEVTWQRGHACAICLPSSSSFARYIPFSGRSAIARRFSLLWWCWTCSQCWNNYWTRLRVCPQYRKLTIPSRKTSYPPGPDLPGVTPWVPASAAMPPNSSEPAPSSYCFVILPADQ